MNQAESFKLEHETNTDLLLYLSKKLQISTLVDRIIKPEVNKEISDNRLLSSITPVIYAINNATKNGVLGVFAGHVKDISRTRGHWKPLEEVCEELGIEVEDLEKVKVREKES